MELWTPDLFSDPLPGFAPADEASAVRAHRILGAHFQRLGAPRGRVTRPAGSGVNSRNLAVHTESGRYLLQCQRGGPDELERVLGVAEWARSRGLPLPRVEPADDGRRLVEWEGEPWFAMEFVEGTHFSGAPGECGSTAVVLRRLREELAECPPDHWPTEVTGPPGETEVGLAHELEATRGAWAGVLGPETAALLDLHWTLVRSELEASLSCVPQGGRELMHFDLHPHNLLMEGGRVRSVIDLSSFRRCDARIFVAFGMLKLMRQAVSRAGGSPDAVRRVRDAFEPAFGSLEPGEAGGLARAEVVRRIFVLLGLSLREGDRRWNHVLPVHLRALAESRLLFPEDA